MRRLLLLALLLLAGAVSATDFETVKLLDTIMSADTAADQTWSKTVYSDAKYIGDWCFLGFYWKIGPTDSNGIALTAFSSDEDSVEVFFQTSHNKDFTDAVSYKIDSATAMSDSGRVGLHLSCIDSTIGDWGRLKLRRRDSTGADMPDSVSVVRGLECKLWLLGRR